MRVLTEEGRELAEEFDGDFGAGNCSCHINPLCSSCIHPGNPINLEESDDLWEEVDAG